MLKKILIGIAALIVVLLIVVALRPSQFRVERSVTIAAPAEVVFGHVNDLQKWTAWSPWEKIDPGMTRTYGASTVGAGATYAWEGNENVGAGRMTVAESTPGELIVIQLEFLKPFESTATAEFAFAPEDGGTRVTWSMHGENNFMAKAMHLVMDVDGMIGGSFEQGLGDLKALSEGQARN